MPASKIGVATRAFVAVLLARARGYQLTLHVNRDSDREALLNPNNPISNEVGLLGGAFFWSLRARLEVEARASRQPRQQKQSLRNRKIDGTQHPEITLSCDESFIKENGNQKSPQPSLES